MLSIDFLKNKKIAIYGMGKSGCSVALALKRGGALPICWDDNVKAREKASMAGLTIEDLSKSDSWQEFSMLLLSPGVPYLHPFISKVVDRAIKAEIPIDNDVGLFFQTHFHELEKDKSKSSKTIAITGSNGKSTTSSLVHHILKNSLGSVQLGGNIGIPLFDLETALSVDATVMELSSYQLEVAKFLNADIAVFLNFSPDHLDRHNGAEGYFNAKKRLFGTSKRQISIIGVDETEGIRLYNELKARGFGSLIKISTKSIIKDDEWSVSVVSGILYEYRYGKLVSEIKIDRFEGLPGQHNHQNICAAFAVCRILDVSKDEIKNYLLNFEALPHRTQVIANINGVLFVNDSKATNAISASKALNSFSNIHWIVGGRAKAGGVKSLIEDIGSVKKAYLIGECAIDFSAQLSHVSHSIVDNLESAVKQAYNNALPGEVILLSPAAASFDNYKNFEERGDHFTKLVNELQN